MGPYHWTGVLVGTLVILAAVALAWRDDKLGVFHVVMVAMGAVLAGIPVISMTMNGGGIASVQIGQLAQAASDANGASQSQQQAIAALNDRITQLALLVSKIPVAAAMTNAADVRPVAPPVAGEQPSPGASPLVLSPKALGGWNAAVFRFRQSGAQVDALNKQSQDLTLSSKRALAN